MARLDKDTQPKTASVETLVVTAIGDFVHWCVGANVPVVRGWTNAVSRPASPYVLITPMGSTWHSTTGRVYTPEVDEAGNPTGRGTLQVVRSTSRRVQVDFYGPDSEMWARTCALLFQDLSGCDFFKGRKLVPLTVTAPQELTGMVGNEQAEPRWMLELEVQLSSELASSTVEYEFFDAVNMTLREQS